MSSATCRRVPRLAPGPPASRRVCVVASAESGRRELLAATLLTIPALGLLSATAPGPAAAEEVAATSQGSLYTDAADKFTIAVPPGWVQGAGDLSGPRNKYSNSEGLRRVVAWFPVGKPEVTVAVTVTTIGPDFTQMGSFGTAQMFGENVVASMDRSYILRMPEWARRKEGPVQLATLLDARESKGAYYIDYCLDKEGEEPRTVYSVVGMGSNGRLRRLYTVNAIALGPDLEVFKPDLQRMVQSFVVPQA